MRARWCGVVMVAAMAVACGDNMPGGVEPTDGARFQLTWFTFEDGQTLPMAKDTFNSYLTDTEMGFACRPRDWADGKLYCVPPEADPIGYLDPQCTNRAARGGTQPYALDETWSCGGWLPHALFRRTGEPLSRHHWIRDATGTCKDQGFGPMAPVEPIAVPELHRNRGGGAAVQPEWLTSEDGLVVATDLYDPMLESTCDLTPLDNQARASCRPTSVAYDVTYADARCSIKGVGGVVGCKVQHVALLSDGSAGAGYHEVGDRIGGAFTLSGGRCTVSVDDTATFGFGPELDLHQLVRAPDAADPHRVRRIFIKQSGAPDSARIQDPDNFYDSELGTECVMRTGDDGTVVCLPYSYAFAKDFYTDSNCRVPRHLIWDYTDEPGMDRAPFTYARDEAIETDPPNRGVRKYGPAVTGTVYSMDSSGACTVALETLYDLGDVVPESALAHATVRNPVVDTISARVAPRDR